MDHSAHGHMDHSAHANMGHDHMTHKMADMDMTAGDCNNSMAHGMGSMAFHGGYCETVLFSGWQISSAGGLIGSMIGVILMAAVYEGLKYYREYLFWKAYNSLQYHAMRMPTEKAGSPGDVVTPKMMCWSHAYQTVLHMVQLVLAYFLMLIFMTYNYWLALAVMLGGGMGYFLFGWKKSVIVDVTEHCH